MTSFDGYDQPEDVDDSSGRHVRRDIESDLRDLIELVANAKQMPLSNSALISRDDVLGLLEQALRDLPDEIRQESAKPMACTGAVRPLDEVEKEYILAALALNGGNQTHTARQLRIGTATLHRKLKGYALDGPQGHPAQGPAAARQVV